MFIIHLGLICMLALAKHNCSQDHFQVSFMVYDISFYKYFWQFFNFWNSDMVLVNVILDNVISKG